MKTLLAVDLGYRGAAILVREGTRGPELCAPPRKWNVWEKVDWAMELRWLNPDALAVERPFHTQGKRRWAGISQRGKHDYLKGMCAILGIRFIEVPPQGARQADLAAKLLRRSLDEQGVKITEHLRDCAAIAIAALGRVGRQERAA